MFKVCVSVLESKEHTHQLNNPFYLGPEVEGKLEDRRKFDPTNFTLFTPRIFLLSIF